LFACLLSFSYPSSANEPHWQQAEYINNSFIDIALNNEYSPEVSRIRKWTKPIFYSIIHRTADKELHQRITQSNLEHLASITGTTIQAASTENKENLKIIFSTEKLIRQELEQYFLLNNKQ